MLQPANKNIQFLREGERNFWAFLKEKNNTELCYAATTKV